MNQKILEKNLSILQGHEMAKDLLIQSLGTGRCATYLLVGPPHIGKGSMAKVIAASIHGLDNIDKKHLDTLVFDDLLEVNSNEDQNKWKKSVDDLIHFINLSPADSLFKVAIIEDIDRLSVQATNALLKTLEEPPRYARIILTAQDIDKVLPTIQSRSQVIKLNQLMDDEIETYVKEKTTDNIEEIILLSNGSLGTTTRLLEDTEFLEQNLAYLNSFKTMLNGKVSDSLKIANIKDREIAVELLTVWINLARRLLSVSMGNSSNKVGDYFKDIKYPQVAVATLIENLQNTMKALQTGANIRIALESLMLNWKWGIQS